MEIASTWDRFRRSIRDGDGLRQPALCKVPGALASPSAGVMLRELTAGSGSGVWQSADGGLPVRRPVQLRMNARISGFSTSAWIVAMPWG